MMMIHRLCISLVLFVVDTTTLGSRIVYLSLSLSLLRARFVRYRRILFCGMRRQLPHLHRWQHVRLFSIFLLESGGGWMVARMEGLLVLL